MVRFEGVTPKESRISVSHVISTASTGAPAESRRMSRTEMSRMISQNEKSRNWVSSSIIHASRKLANAAWFTVFTGLLTLYALFGDDVRLATTSGHADPIFNGVTILALAAFTTEVAVGAIGKEGYFLSFYFWLDTVTTVTLVMDITLIAQEINTWMTSGEDEGSSSVTRASRASRLGSKAGRVARVIRLIRLLRIVKLYRTAMEARQAKLRKAREALRAKIHPDNEDGDDDSDDEFNGESDFTDGGERESRVGKQLSERTTMRVIVLVLILLFVLPLLTFSQWEDEFSTSAQYGADVVSRNWSRWVNAAVAKHANDEAPTHSRESYEKSLLLYAFYHNWNTSRWECSENRNCPAEYSLPLMWIGYIPPSKFALDPQLTSSKYNCLNDTNIGLINDEFNSDNWIYEMGELLPDVLRNLSKPWDQLCDCENMKKCHGVNIMTHGEDGADEYPCPQNQQIHLVPFGEDPVGLRFTEYVIVTSISSFDREQFGRFLFYFDQRSKVKDEAVLNLGQTLVVVLVLALGALFFSKDANTLVLAPIERMIGKMEKIRDDPLAAMKLGDQEYRREELAKKAAEAGLPRKNPMWKFWADSGAPVQEPMETAVLEKTIIKIGGLLALGFGEAGANIIGQNMKGNSSATVDAVVPGRKVYAIFGFCVIRNFTDVTEILQDRVMLFVNQIGEIVHGVVDEYNGAPNKNIGDAFLLVWQSPVSAADRQRIADLAVLSYCRIVLGVNQSPTLAAYRGHPGLLQRLPNYRVRLGFGFHYGWAIEGAIGSEFKIDASYLSPNVNIASRLEAATRQFDISMLMSHLLYDLCSKPVSTRCRVVDRVSVKGSNVDIGLYTLDLDITGIEVHCPDASKFVKNRYKARQIREQMKLAKLSEDYSVEAFFSDEREEHMISMRRLYTSEFLKKCTMAYRNYEAGEWAVSKDMFESTRKILGMDDGPSTTLLNYMKEYNFIAPPTWRGFRELTEK